jgi:hypothetical protein
MEERAERRWTTSMKKYIGPGKAHPLTFIIAIAPPVNEPTRKAI